MKVKGLCPYPIDRKNQKDKIEYFVIQADFDRLAARVEKLFKAIKKIENKKGFLK